MKAAGAAPSAGCCIDGLCDSGVDRFLTLVISK